MITKKIPGDFQEAVRVSLSNPECNYLPAFDKLTLTAFFSLLY